MSKSEIKRYLSAIGSKGGKKSKRKLTKKQAKEMARKRWALTTTASHVTQPV